jgi:hypothetical protein
MLEPIADGSSAGGETSNDVVVLPHSFQQGIYDQHQFMIRNDGKKVLKGGKVSLTAPVGSMIQQVIPKPDSISGLNIELAPGEHEIVEVAIKYPRDELAHFETKIVSRDWVDSSPSNEPSEVASNREGMLAPRAMGILKPKVPAMTVSAATSRIANDRPIDVSKMLVPYLPIDAQPLELKVPAAVGVEGRSVTETPPPEPENWKPTIEVSLDGPSSAAVGEEIEFSIEVENRSPDVCESVIVQLSVPEKMKVTILDRAAWYDSESRKVSWEIANLGSGETESIRYKAMVKTGCSIEQMVVTGAGGKFQSKSTIQTTAN